MNDPMELLSQRFTTSPDVLVQEVSDEAVLLDLASETYFGLNEVGVRLWHLLSENGDPEAAVSTLLGEYDVDAETLRHDVAAHLEMLSSKGLIRVADAEASSES